ncbi:MAG: hypothetical protein K2J61_06505 [Clostridia bacterium]|nr:hypothetical protein [Clostridia bacterium]
MSEKDLKEQEENTENTQASTEEQTEENGGKSSLICFYIAIACFAVGCVLFGISFAIKGAGVYLLISSMISELASVTFLNAQKRHGENKACKIIRILSYVVMAAGIIVFVVGTVLSASAK